MDHLEAGTGVVLISYSPTDDGIPRLASVDYVKPSLVVVDGIEFPAGGLPVWSIVDRRSNGFVRHYIEEDTDLARRKYGLDT